MKKAISKAAITFAAALTSGALAFAARQSAEDAALVVALAAFVFGFLAVAADSLEG